MLIQDALILQSLKSSSFFGESLRSTPRSSLKVNKAKNPSPVTRCEVGDSLVSYVIFMLWWKVYGLVDVGTLAYKNKLWLCMDANRLKTFNISLLIWKNMYGSKISCAFWLILWLKSWASFLSLFSELNWSQFVSFSQFISFITYAPIS